MEQGDSFGTRGVLTVGGRDYEIHRLDRIVEQFPHVASWPFAVRILLENLLRNEDGVTVTRADIETMLAYDPRVAADVPTLFMPARVLLQDFTGVPTIANFAGMRAAMEAAGGDPALISPSLPADLIMDHSIMVDHAGTSDAARLNQIIEYERNRERYRFLRWGAETFEGLRVIPPGGGIVHQINVEYLASVVFTDGHGRAYPDTLVGLDSHTTMVNGLGVLGWGVGGIEAEAAMLGQPVSMLVPGVVGLRLHGELPDGTTATDLVLTITEMLREHGVVGKIVEFFGEGVRNVPLENRATIGNMSPEYGSTASIFPVDEETLRYLRFTGRSDEQVALVEAYMKEQGLFHDPERRSEYEDIIELDLATVVPSLAGPSRPKDRVPLTEAKASFREALVPHSERSAGPAEVTDRLGRKFTLQDGSVIIAGITSCTNTSNPQVMIAAGLLAKNAVERGLTVKPWVKTSLAPGSRVVMDYYDHAGLLPYLEKLGYHLVGFGCATCSGNSGPIDEPIATAIETNGLSVVAVLSGNRNFEGRINPHARMNYLASPPLVIAYALAGTMDIDLYRDPLGHTADGEPLYLRDIWPSTEDVERVIRESVQAEMFHRRYASIDQGDDLWESLGSFEDGESPWDPDSTYLKPVPFWENMRWDVPDLTDVRGARVLAVLGDSVTTDHISPGSTIPADSPAGRWLIEHGIEEKDFNSYGARRGNHEVMMRGGFAGIRVRNRMVPGVEGGYTLLLPEGQRTTIFEAAMAYMEQGVPAIVIAGQEYGTGSSRDWAAKAPRLLGVRAVIAESFERIHRSNLIGMGILPLQFSPGDSAESLGLTGHEVFDILGFEGQGRPPSVATVVADGRTFEVLVRLDTSLEQDYFRHGGILDYVMRNLRNRQLAEA